MFEIVFAVKANALPEQRISVVGSLPELGDWNPQKAPLLTQKQGVWESVRFKLDSQTKFEFKLVKIHKDTTIEWETLPNNSNRKYRPKASAKLHLEWSQPEGRVTGLGRPSFKDKGNTNVNTHTPSPERRLPKKQSEFDPYRRAHQDSGSDSEQEFVLTKRKMSDQIQVDCCDLEQIYYNSNPLQIFCGLLKKFKLYVISRDIDDTPLLHIEQQLKSLPHDYLAKWVTADSLFSKTEHPKIKPKRLCSLYDILDQEVHLESLYSRTSYFLFLQIETVLKFQAHIGTVPCCLLLPSTQYQQTIDSLPLLGAVQLISFDSAETNRALNEYLTNNGQIYPIENELTVLNVPQPSIEAIVKELRQLKYRDIIHNTQGSISETQALSLVGQHNTVTIVDGSIADHYPSFINKLVVALDHYSMLIIVAPGPSLSQQILNSKDCKNVALVYGQFQKVILEGKEYHPLRKFREMLDLFRMKAKLYLQNYGGDFTQKESSMIYTLPQGHAEWATRVEAECRNVSRDFGFVRVSRRGDRVKMSWNLSVQARMMRTLCEIKYTNYGPLGNFSIISDTMGLRELKDALRLLVEHKSKLFISQDETKVRYFSYGGSELATCHILPETTSLISQSLHG